MWQGRYRHPCLFGKIAGALGFVVEVLDQEIQALLLSRFGQTFQVPRRGGNTRLRLYRTDLVEPIAGGEVIKKFGNTLVL